jgi:hypothetical protein
MVVPLRVFISLCKAEPAMKRSSFPAVLVVVLAAGFARADPTSAPTDEQKASARLLGTDGVRFAMAGDCRNAVDKLARAEAIMHAPTTALPLAKCQIQLGKIIAGTEILNRLLNEVLPTNAPEPWVEAQRQVQPLLDAATPKIGKLRIHVERPATGTGDLQVTVDGEPVPSVILDNDRATDPGPHHVAASAPGFTAAAADISLAEGQSQTVVLRLEPLPGGSAPASAFPAAMGAPPVAEVPSSGAPAAPDVPAQSSPNRVPAYVVLGLGGAGIVVGTVFGILALGNKSSLDSDCPRGKDACPVDKQPEIDSLDSSLKTNALLSTLGLAVGVVGVGIGTYLFVSARSDGGPKSAHLEVRPWIGPGSAGLRGSFF